MTLTAVHETAVVDYQLDGRVAVLVIDNPPVNASSAAVRAGLLSGVRRAGADSDVDAVVLIGAGSHFISGSDLREFNGPLPEPTLPELISAIEDCPKPVVAALCGATLGGGLELALGCDARIAAEDSVIGLPEITLGMIPGAGGTQRPLRLIGPVATLDLISSGARRQVTTVGALIDVVTDAPLRAAAVAHAGAMTGKRILRAEPIRADDAAEVTAAALDVLTRGRGRPQYGAAVAAVLNGLVLDPDAALSFERREFTRLRVGEEAAALRHLFFARRAATKANRPRSPRALRSVGIIGAGTMGSGIARAFVEHGVAVVLVDQNPDAAARAAHTVRGAAERLVQSGRLSAADARRRAGLLTAGAALDDVAGCDLIIEAVFEDMTVKTDLLIRLQQVVAPDTVLATNTSYLDIDAMAQALDDRTRLVGMHFFSPAHRAAVLEVVHGAHTGTYALDTALTAAQLLQKLPIVARVCEGFIGNRIYNAYRRQCELMLEEGALPHQIDEALVGFGFAMGPFAVSDMSGLDIAWRMRQATAGRRDPRERYPDVADILCEEGRLGQKTGAGWYRYEAGSRTPIVDPHVAELIRSSSERKQIQRRVFSAADIVERVLLTMANEAALLLTEGIAERPGDVDLMLTTAYGFPSHVGGLTPWVLPRRAELGLKLDELAAVTGYGFRRGDLGVFAAAEAGQ
ncbi:3-hydroxyacyl-CoA dehydrogenase [Mycolicibacterium mageritense DSM 44476 = CIP 104973]|uniref:3-hydroxyacyl-CoA dehydrogenase n=1 Tax=Mycolicibacterium mageritense TaxID=53462 RepID=A0ABN5YKG7_MYCME|nr:3-hydroxyacyl-CoA dehydrogenase NAD-binding domain-containing protein [Mycolicibacterium mageritense]MCC9180430.1 3-hydroxyacyl-CoA dehydrogenase NAD-binding domain-containing protein [Mycolicibacterium mageritense]BBX37677.1 3-hydroxyacyl-CoA dehydrogenase [Mycolicibacterium mageritense]CDO25658.1 fatty oxidation protein FadB [Mycolicibacterium mageritense DSM 44476 = CIP 104973]